MIAAGRRLESCGPDPRHTLMPEKTTHLEISMSDRNRGVEILAKSIYRDLMAQGFAKRDVVNLATALLDQVTTTMAAEATTRD